MGERMTVPARRIVPALEAILVGVAEKPYLK